MVDRGEIGGVGQRRIARAPLIFRPHETLMFYKRLWATNRRARALSTLYIALGICSLLGSAQTSAVAALFLFGLGIALFGLSTWALATPAHFRGVFDRLLGFVDESVRTSAQRFRGVLGVALGSLLVWLGVRGL